MMPGNDYLRSWTSWIGTGTNMIDWSEEKVL